MKIQYYADIPPDAYTPYIARYYDNYDFININSGNTGHRHLFEVSSPTVTATGLQTGSAVASSSYSTLYTAYRYDEKGNVVYSEEWDEYLQSHRLSVSSAYDFTGNETIRTEKYEEMAEQTVIDTHTARFTSSYDALGRILSQHLSVDGAAPVLVFSNGYDAIGRLSQQWRGTQVTYGYDIRSHLSGTASDIYTERVHYAVDAGASAGLEQASWPTFRFANRIEESWPERADSLPERSLDWYLYYDGLGRLSGGVSHDSGYSETVDTDLDANVREVRRVFRGAAVQDAVIGYTAGMATDVRDVSSPYYGERVGRFPAGDYTLSYDAAGRLIADGTRGITAIHYNDWSLIPAVITADGLRVNTEVSADGILRSRIVRVPRIETVIKVTADGDTIVKERTRYLIYGYKRYGCFEYQSAPGSTGFRVSTSVGYYDIGEGRQYWYLQNRLGSVMALVDSDGNVQRRSGHYPGGIPFVLDGDDSHVPDPCKPDDRHHIGNHWLSQGGLNWYDNTARMHDPLLMRFTTPDPLARDFTHLSPWSHCAANPANNTDPDGKDIVVLNYGTGRNQHLAMLIQNEDGKWQYYSINGNNIYISGQHKGGRKFNDIAVGSWNSPQEFFNSSYNVRNNKSKDNKAMNHFGFKEGYQISTTKEQDAIMREKFKEKSKDRYSPLGNNCATVVQRVMFDAGIPVATPKYETIHVPANFYLGEPEYNIVRPKIDPWPSSAFKTIMKVNPGGIYYHR